MKAAVTLPDAGADERAEMIRITGRVQGVGFRASAQHLALQYGVRGWVANVGRGVVIHACAPPDRLDAFVRALGETSVRRRASIVCTAKRPRLLSRGASFVIARTDTPLSGAAPRS
jgi:acylphosphatase